MSVTVHTVLRIEVVIPIIDVPKKWPSTFMKILLNFNQLANLKSPLCWWAVGTWSKLSGSLKGSEGDQEPSLASCPNPKCLKETTKINFNHVPGSSFFEEEKWGGGEKGREDCEQLSRHAEVSANTSLFLRFKAWEVVKSAEFISSANSLGEKKKKPAQKGRETATESSFLKTMVKVFENFLATHRILWLRRGRGCFFLFPLPQILVPLKFEIFLAQSKTRSN